MHGPPAVKYRGIFLNDEAPDLTGWAKEKFGGYNHGFYTNVFELLLRLKANYLWPAMWDNCFNEDDPLNPKLANEYGIVMGTSHVEPMMRADKEWNRAGFAASQWNYEKSAPELGVFWKQGIERNQAYENIVTIAMRGKIDTPMSETANIALLEKIVAAQRAFIADVYQTNAAAVPQLWALYKEVQEYYERGMRVPDDVTLLWCDDNWGNLRKLPAASERKRSGGAGIYYHFDYVGGPRNYKWVNTSPISRIWEQMNLAHEYGANQIWIVNVGHLQHVAFPTEFFLTLAREPDRWPKEKLSEFTRLWAEREFGRELAPQIAAVMTKFTKFNARRKPELLAPETYSLVDYQEADNMIADWKTVADDAEKISAQLAVEKRDAFFELVLYPVKTCANLNALYVAAAKNHLYAAQGRTSAKNYAAEVERCFETDRELSDFYNHKLANGKWNHMMDQTHIGYTGWQQPEKNIMPRVTEIALPDEAKMGVAVEGATNVWPDFPGEAVLPAFDKFNRPSRSIDVFNRGQAPFDFSATASAPWIFLKATNNGVEKERLWVSVNWKKAPPGDVLRRRRVSPAGTCGATRVTDAGRGCRHSGSGWRVHPPGSAHCRRRGERHIRVKAQAGGHRGGRTAPGDAGVARHPASAAGNGHFGGHLQVRRGPRGRGGRRGDCQRCQRLSVGPRDGADVRRIAVRGGADAHPRSAGRVAQSSARFQDRGIGGACPRQPPAGCP